MSDRLSTLTLLVLAGLVAQGSTTGASDPDLGRYVHEDAVSCDEPPPGWLDELSFFFGIDGSKQTQDFGVNAHVGSQASLNWGVPLVPEWGIGGQIGTNFTAHANAVQVLELLGETKDRQQSYTTIGLFQRIGGSGRSIAGRIGWGVAWDYLNQDYYDDFDLNQWRLRGTYGLTDRDEVGIHAAIRGGGDDGIFGSATPVTLRPITQGYGFWRHFWATGAQTTFWAGASEGHGENNAVTGPADDKDNQFLFGADVLMPLSDRLAIYGEANFMMPVDTGTVDAFLGVQYYVGGRRAMTRRGRYNPMFSTASPVAFSVDLR